MRDEKGRRRLHGAFTGGFSAGYFNGVGSKEGVFQTLSVRDFGAHSVPKDGRPRHLSPLGVIGPRSRRRVLKILWTKKTYRISKIAEIWWT